MEELKGTQYKQGMVGKAVSRMMGASGTELAELRDLLETGGYATPAPYNGESDARNVEQLGRLETDAIDDRMIMLGHIFSVEAFMHRWNQAATLSHRAEVRDAFLRNYHRANRLHLASIAMAQKMQFIAPQPEIEQK